MHYRFDLSEFAEAGTTVHGPFEIGIYLHPVFFDPALFTTYARRDPILAWIFVRPARGGAVLHTLNAQYDRGMRLPFFLNLHYGFMGENIPTSHRATQWSRSELESAVIAYLEAAA
jgi:hypothetical protein